MGVALLLRRSVGRGAAVRRKRAGGVGAGVALLLLRRRRRTVLAGVPDASVLSRRAQLFAVVPMSALECYPMGGYRTGPFAAPPLATGWGGFDGCSGCADCQQNSDFEGNPTFNNMGRGMYDAGVGAPQASARCVAVFGTGVRARSRPEAPRLSTPPRLLRSRVTPAVLPVFRLTRMFPCPAFALPAALSPVSLPSCKVPHRWHVGPVGSRAGAMQE